MQGFPHIPQMILFVEEFSFFYWNLQWSAYTLVRYLFEYHVNQMFVAPVRFPFTKHLET